MPRFIRSLSGHVLENISDGRLTNVIIARPGVTGDEDWGLYGMWRDATQKLPILTRSMVEKTLCAYHPKERELQEVLHGDEATIKLFCLTLMDSFCQRLNSGDAVVAVMDVLEDAVSRIYRGI